jgi:hypothetical protein
MIEPAAAVGDLPDAAVPPRPGRRLLFGLVVAVVVLGLALAVVSAALLSGGPGRTTGPGTGSTAVSPLSSQDSAASLPASPTAGGAVLDQLDQIVTDALAAGRIDEEAAHKLREQLANLREDAGRGRIRKRVQTLKKTIDELRGDEKIDQATADQLNALLDKLVGGD